MEDSAETIERTRFEDVRRARERVGEGPGLLRVDCRWKNGRAVVCAEFD